MKVVSYLNTVPAKNLNTQKTELLVKFVSGVNKIGDKGILHNGNNEIDSDVGIIQGWVYQDISSPHLKLRKNVIDNQIYKNKFVVSADANLFLYNDISNLHGYLRYSFNGVFPNTGIYCDDVIDSKRCQQIFKDTGIVIEDYKHNGKNIVLMLQRNGGWSMGNTNVCDWMLTTIKQIRKYTDRPILIRPHPGDKRATTYLSNINLTIEKNVTISSNVTSLDNDLKNAWAVVNHNSSAVVGPIIKGYPAFITDPDRSQCAEVANTDFSLIENPNQYDRQKWLERISMFHWKFSELEDGSAWSHMRNYVCQ
jgi:hypothetical protein